MYRLYGRRNAGSVCVQVLLEEAGVPYEMVWVENVRAPDFLKVNPNGKVPALQLPGGEIIYESAAMMAFLAETLPAASMRTHCVGRFPGALAVSCGSVAPSSTA